MRPTILKAAAVAAAGLVARQLIRHARALDLVGKVVLITGGARGLGLELARLAMTEGARVAICARSAEQVQAAADELRLRGPDVLPLVADVTAREGIARVVAAVEERWGSIDVLVNNAGIIGVGPLEHMTEDDFERAMATHFWAPLRLTEAVLPGMRKKRAGRIVNIASFGGRVPVPHMAPYTASKFALVGLSEALRIELAREGIRVTTVSPGPMRTGSHLNATFKGRHRDEYTWFSIADAIPMISTNSTWAARRILAALKDGRAALDIGIAPLAAALHGVAPGLVTDVAALVNRLLPEPGGIGERARLGSHSESRWSPSALTTLAERAAQRNNEI